VQLSNSAGSHRRHLHLRSPRLIQTDVAIANRTAIAAAAAIQQRSSSSTAATSATTATDKIAEGAAVVKAAQEPAI